MRVFNEAYLICEKPVIAEIVKSVLSKQINELEPVLVRNSYNVKSLSEQFNINRSEIRALLEGRLDVAKSLDLLEQLKIAGLPI